MSWLITGGTGSLGNALTRRLLADGIDRLAIYSRDELKQAEMAERFSAFGRHPHGPLRFLLGDVRDKERLTEAFHGVEVVVHAAALKRVDATAYSPAELVKTNTIGTLNVIHAAVDAQVKKVLLISSDKAVEPTNPYGASKMMAEHICVAINASSYPRGTAVSVLRYGNVLGSRGSVVHIWRKQIEAGEPVTITDPEMTRFVLTLPEAAGYVLEAVERMEGGEIFVPVLPSMKMLDLLDAVSEGYANRVVTGLRAGGEKLHESLLNPEETTRTFIDQRPDQGEYDDACGNLMAAYPALHSWREVFPKPGMLFPVRRYTSDRNGWWLTVSELRKKLEDT